VSIFRQNIAIDLGTATVLVSVEKRGIIIKAPSIVAVKEGTNNILAIGDEAKKMMGRTPLDIETVKPIKSGVISNYSATEKMLAYFIDKAIRNPLKRVFKPDVMICIPCKITGVEKRSVQMAASEAGAGRTFLIEEPLAAAVGAGLEITKPIGSMVVDIGGGTTDVAVISFEGIVVSRSVKVAGDKYDEAIVSYMRKKYNVLIGERTAEELKINVGSVYPGCKGVSEQIRGRDLVSGLPVELMVTTEELVETLMDVTIDILNCIHSVLEETPPELAADIYTRGIVMTGGGALLTGLDKLINNSTGIDVTIADEPQYCVVRGTLKALTDMTEAQKASMGKIKTKDENNF